MFLICSNMRPIIWTWLPVNLLSLNGTVQQVKDFCDPCGLPKLQGSKVQWNLGGWSFREGRRGPGEIVFIPMLVAVCVSESFWGWKTDWLHKVSPSSLQLQLHCTVCTATCKCKQSVSGLWIPETVCLHLQLAIHNTQCNWICRLGRYLMLARC